MGIRPQGDKRTGVSVARRSSVANKGLHAYSDRRSNADSDSLLPSLAPRYRARSNRVLVCVCVLCMCVLVCVCVCGCQYVDCVWVGACMCVCMRECACVRV